MDAPKNPPTTEVNRKGLIRLLFRYKGLLEAELSYLESLPPESETVFLHLPQSRVWDSESCHRRSPP